MRMTRWEGLKLRNLTSRPPICPKTKRKKKRKKEAAPVTALHLFQILLQVYEHLNGKCVVASYFGQVRIACSLLHSAIQKHHIKLKLPEDKWVTSLETIMPLHYQSGPHFACQGTICTCSTSWGWGFYWRGEFGISPCTIRVLGIIRRMSCIIAMLW